MTMNSKLIFVFLSVLVVGLQADYDFGHEEECVKEANIDVDTLKTLAPEKDQLPEDNEHLQKLFGCYYRDFLNDSNELVVDDKFDDFITAILTRRVKGKSKLARLLAKDCIEHCKDIKGDSKNITAIKIVNCIKKRFYEYVDE